jgi:hypothetical protein
MLRFSSKKGNISENKDGSPHNSDIYCALEKLKKCLLAIKVGDQNISPQTRKKDGQMKKICLLLYLLTPVTQQIFLCQNS